METMVYDWLADVITAKNKSCEKIDFIDTPIDGICFEISSAFLSDAINWTNADWVIAAR